jgi:hypothetical protein
MNVPCQHLDFVVSPDPDGELPISPSIWIECSERLATRALAPPAPSSSLVVISDMSNLGSRLEKSRPSLDYVSAR